jgi:glycosyltransferase involved in cell wall biosynthesis
MQFGPTREVGEPRMQQLPYVSVVIPTHNRQHELRETLDALARQTWPLSQCEVVVVDDGSTDSTASIAEVTFPFALRYVRQDNQGGFAARNTGVRHSRGDILIFVDDDITVEPEYIACLVQELTAYDRVLVKGTVHPWSTSEGSVFRTVAAEEIVRQVSPTSDWVGFANVTSNNLAVKREDFFTIGMWQDVGGDPQTLWLDADFAYRAAQLGFRFRQSAGAVLYHRDYAARDLATTCRRAEIAARRAVRLFRKYPELESQMPMFRDKGYVRLRTDPPQLVVRKAVRTIVARQPVLSGLEAMTHLLEARFPKPLLLRPLYRWIVGSYILRGYRQGLREYTFRG